MQEAYQPIIDDGRGRFPEDLRVKAPRGAKAAIAAAAERRHTSHSKYVRQALLRSIEADGVRLRRGQVEVAGEAAFMSGERGLSLASSAIKPSRSLLSR